MRPKAVLLVEDNPDDVELTLRAFQKNRLANEVVVVSDGLEALDYLHGTGKFAGQGGDLPQVVLLDLKMPRMSGHEVLRRIRADERTRLLPVVILTSSSEEQDLLSCYQDGANSFVRKPVNFEEFIEATRQLQLYWLVLNQPPPNQSKPG